MLALGAGVSVGDAQVGISVDYHHSRRLVEFSHVARRSAVGKVGAGVCWHIRCIFPLLLQAAMLLVKMTGYHSPEAGGEHLEG